MTLTPDSNLNVLLDLHINTLYRRDADGRLRWVNEAGDPPPPRFYMLRSQAGNRWCFRHDLPRELVTELDALCHKEPSVREWNQPHQHGEAIRALLNQHAPIEREYCGPAYYVSGEIVSNTSATFITQETSHTLRPHFDWAREYVEDARLGPVVGVIVDDIAVALCFCSRIPGQATEAGVETIPAARGHGYASAAVATWANELRRRNVLPMYSTSWDNLVSQRIAAKFGMVQYGEDWSVI